MKVETIAGWSCWVNDRGQRQVREQISLATATWSFKTGLSSVPSGMPTRVLGWLVKPLLRTAYAEGWSDRNGQLDGSEMPEVYKDEP